MGEGRKRPKKRAGQAVSPDETPKSVGTEHAQFIEEAMAEYESPLIGYAMGIVRDLDRARDVVQDTFIRLSQQDPDKVRKGLKSWLFTVCRNRSLDILRKESRLQALPEAGLERTEAPGASPDEACDREERLAEVMRYLDRLSENQRKVILMKFRDGYSYKEISERTGLSGGNVGFLIHAGMKRLRQWLPADLRKGGSA